MSDTHFIREPTPNDPGPSDETMTVMVGGDDSPVRIKDNGEVEVETPDGGITIYPNGIPKKSKESANDFDANLAEHIDEGELARISEELLTGIESDNQSRGDWLDARAKGIGLLALKIEAPRSAASDGGTMEGISVVRSPLLLESVLRFQANAVAELLPSDGPVKVANEEPPKTRQQEMLEQMSGVPKQPKERDVLADALERDFNRYLTTVDREYYADFRRMLFYTGFGGSGFRKVYRCPLKRRPVSRAIDAADLIVADPEVSLHDAGRVTHRILMRQSVLKRMQLAGQYRNANLGVPVQTEENAVELKEADVMGFDVNPQLPADYKHTIYECYCELDLNGFEHTEDGEETGLPLPYRVTLDKESRQILEIRRNWKEDDDQYRALMPIVKYPFVEGLGFYGFGLLHILGNSTAAVTAAWRLALDAGMMASFPAFLYSDVVSRQNTNVMRLVPGGGTKINTGGLPISETVMPAPYHDATAGLISMMNHVEETAGRVGGTAEISVGEGNQQAPVGTTMAMLDQATKIMAAVHKGLHAAQAEEFELLADLFKEDPDALLAGSNEVWEREELINALNDKHLIPKADPNTPSHMIRVMRAMALLQLYQLNPAAWDYKEVVKRIARMVGENEVDELFAPPQPPSQAPDPNAIMAQAALIQAQAKAKDTDMKPILQQMKAAQDAQKIKSSERVEAMKLGATLAIHPEAQGVVDQTVNGTGRPQ
jgi:hypothetical protein